MQNLIGRRVLSEISKRTDTEFKASSVRFSNFERLEIEDLYIEDENHDTLLYVPKLVAIMDSMSRSSRFVRLQSIALTSPVINISQDDSGQFNFMFLVDSLVNPDKVDSLAWTIDFHDVSLENGQLALALLDTRPLQSSDLDISLSINDHHFVLEELSFALDNGFNLEKSYADIRLDDYGIYLPQLSLTSANSSIILRDIAAISKDSIFKESSLDKLSFQIQSNNSYISGRDISCFLSPDNAFENSIVVDGLIDGNMASLKGHDLHLKIDSLLDLNSEFEVKNLNSLEDLSFNLEINELLLDIVASADAYNKFLPGKAIDISSYAHWEQIRYIGSIAGTKDLFTTAGAIKTKYGDLNTDLSVSLYDSVRTIQYNGNISAHKFHAGRALQSADVLGDASVKLFVSGGIQPNGQFGNFFKGEISSLYIKDYHYSGITLQGGVGKSYFNGHLNVEDENAKFDFNGKVDILSQEPSFDFTLNAEYLALANLNLTTEYEQLDLAFNIDSKLKGNRVDDVNGYLGIYNLAIETEHDSIVTDSINFNFKPLDAMPSIVLSSDYINGLILGSYNFSELLGFFNSSLKKHLEYLPQQFKEPQNKTPNDFDFVFEIDDLSGFATTLDLPLRENGFAVISGEIDSRHNIYNLEADIPYLLTRKQILDSVYISLDNDDDQFNSEISIETFTFGIDHVMNDIRIGYDIVEDTMLFSTTWENDGRLRYDGDYAAKVWLEPYGKQLKTIIETQPSDFVIANSSWRLNKHQISILPQHISVDSLVFESRKSYFLLDGIASDDKADTLRFEMDRFRLANIDRFLDIKNFNFDGIMSGNTELYGLLKNPVFVTDIRVDSMSLNHSEWGNLTAVSAWDANANALNLYVDCESLEEGDNTLSLSGVYHPDKDSLDAVGNLDGFDIGFLKPYLEQTLANLRGLASGEVVVKGSIKNPELYGALKMNEGGFRIDYLGTDFFVNDSIKFDKNRFVFDDTQVQDQEGNVGVVTGDVVHTKYKNMLVDLVIRSDRFMGLNTTAIENEYFFGDIYFGGAITIKSNATETVIGSRASTMEGSMLTVPLSPISTAATNNFINYAVKVTKEDSIIERHIAHTVREVKKPAKELIIDMNFNVTSDASLRLEFDAQSGNVIDATGNGDLNIKFQRGQPFQIFGEYEIEKGDYLLTLQQIFNKKFDIDAGSTLRWSGRPGDAMVDIIAVYPTRASLYNLMPDAINESSKNRRVPVDVKMLLTQRLSQPNISFDIELPNTDAETQQSVSSIINTEEEMSRQVLSLLITNSFYTPEYYTSNTSASQTNNQLSNVAAVTASEFLSNQLSNWMSQISDNFDLGFHYIPEQELTDEGLTPEEYQMAISTQFFNDRLTVNAMGGYQDYAAEARPPNVNSNFVGEVDVELKLNKHIKLKAYSHQNDDILYENSSMKQGAGITYQEDFTTVKELGGRYKKRIGKVFKRKEKNNEEATRKEEEDVLDEEPESKSPPVDMDENIEDNEDITSDNMKGSANNE